MSTTSKLNPKSLAIKEKLHCRLGLTKKRYVTSVRSDTENGKRNAEWSVPISSLSALNPDQNLSNDIIFNKIEKWNDDVWNLSKEQQYSFEQAELARRAKSEAYGLNSTVLQYLSIALGHSSVCICDYYVALSEPARPRAVSTASKHVEYLRRFHDYFKGLPSSEVIEEDGQ